MGPGNGIGEWDRGMGSGDETRQLTWDRIPPALHRITRLTPTLKAILLLTCSNVFMTFAWYAHLKELNTKPWFVAALVSWGIALFEYLLQVPANRIGYSVMSV